MPGPGLVLEATRAIGLACSATLVVPSLLLVLVGAGRRRFVVAGALGAVAGTFATVAWAPRPPDLAHGLAMAVGWVAVARASTRSPTGNVRTPETTAGVAGAMTVGLTTGLLWRPCVGAHLGDALTSAVASPWSELPAIGAYTLVLTAPAVLGAAAWRPGRPGESLTRRLAAAGLVVGLALSTTVALGAGDELTAALYRWSR